MRLGDLSLGDVVVTALVRGGRRMLHPVEDTPLAAGDTLVLFGTDRDVRAAEAALRH
jgi:uncharacterized protein with PhoU and TrkA domain